MRREAGEDSTRLDLATLPSAPFWARRFTNATLHAWQLWPETIETAELLVSEMVTNAIRTSILKSEHGLSSRIEQVECISLTLRLLAGRIIIEVFDKDPHPPVLAEAEPDSESGRGLMIVQALSKEWGHFFPPTGGKTVFCVLGTPDPAGTASHLDGPQSWKA